MAIAVVKKIAIWIQIHKLQRLNRVFKGNNRQVFHVVCCLKSSELAAAHEQVIW